MTMNGNEHHQANGGHRSLQSLIYDSSSSTPSLKVLDQLQLPTASEWISVLTVQDAWSVIRRMNVRGAPLIAVVACLGLAVDLHNPISTAELNAMERMHGERQGPAVLAYIQGKMTYLTTSRPTAVNLFNAMDELGEKLQAELDRLEDSDDKKSLTRQVLVSTVKSYAEFALERDREDNRLIGKWGADALLAHCPDDDDSKKLVILTICNTGSLATSNYGTALGVVRALHERNRLQQVYALETRPYNQGSRLTAYELMQDQLPRATLICDSMAAALMKLKHVDAVIVGADRVCANGDTANKIGTYSLALVASAHQVPVYVAAPFTTLDISIPDGNRVVIEERPSEELLKTSGAPPDIAVWNPSFDVTPARYLAGIITERGVVQPAVDGTMDIMAFVRQHANDASPRRSIINRGFRRESTKLHVPIYYTEQTVKSMPRYLADRAPEAMKRLEATSAADLKCVEMGDGNLNLVFIVTNTVNGKQVIVKQALPYVRCVGESWPLTLERAFFEYKALSAQKEACPEFVPTIYFFSRPNGLMVMEYLAPPNIILRKGLIQGIRYPTMAQDMGLFCARTLFKTSGFHLSTTELRAQVEFWSKNSEMCLLTEQVVFTEPYMTHPNNRWTTPQLDDDKATIEADTELHMAATRWKEKFVTQTSALIHADLHTGSVMCSPEPHKTFVIDPEFAFYGPMGFDTGAFIANLFLSYVSQAGHKNGEDSAEWVLDQIPIFWNTFQSEFTSLWRDSNQHTGFLYALESLKSEEMMKQCHDLHMKFLLSETLGFAGMKMLRRIVGIAHVEDLDSIEDASVRALCERRGLEIAKTFIKLSHTFDSIEDAVAMARNTK